MGMLKEISCRSTDRYHMYHNHEKFRIVCLDTDVLRTALVAIHNARFNPIPEPIENRLTVVMSRRMFNFLLYLLDIYAYQ